MTAARIVSIIVSASGRSSAACGRDPDRPTRDVGVRSGVGDDRVRALAEQGRTAVVVGDGGADARAAVVAPDPRVDRGDRERGVREVSLHLGALLDLRDDRGVEADTEVEHEAPPVRDAEPDPLRRARRERRQQLRRPLRRGRTGRRACGRTRWSTRRGAARAQSAVPASPAAASLSVPSPASTATTSAPSRAASAASSVACSRRAVSTATTSCSAARRRSTSRRVCSWYDDAAGSRAGRDARRRTLPVVQSPSWLRTPRRSSTRSPRDRRVPRLPAARRVARSGRSGQAGRIPRRAVLGEAGSRVR